MPPVVMLSWAAWLRCTLYVPTAGHTDLITVTLTDEADKLQTSLGERMASSPLKKTAAHLARLFSADYPRLLIKLPGEDGFFFVSTDINVDSHCA